MGDEKVEPERESAGLLETYEPVTGEIGQVYPDNPHPVPVDIHTSIPFHNDIVAMGLKSERAVEIKEFHREFSPEQPRQDMSPSLPLENESVSIQPDIEYLVGLAGIEPDVSRCEMDVSEHSIAHINHDEGVDPHGNIKAESCEPAVVDAQEDSSEPIEDTKMVRRETYEACENVVNASPEANVMAGDAGTGDSEQEATTESSKARQDVISNTVEATELIRPETSDPGKTNCIDTQTEDSQLLQSFLPKEFATPIAEYSALKDETKLSGELNNGVDITMVSTAINNGDSSSKHSLFLDTGYTIDGSESGTEEQQSTFMEELENFFRERSMEFKPPKFYGEGLNLLKLWKAVVRLGGYETVTSCKLWRQVGESFRPPKTCTTVSWTFRGFYEKALLDYERYKIPGSGVTVPTSVASHSEPNVNGQAIATGRARRESATRAMQGWHSQRGLGNGEVTDPIVKDKNYNSFQKREKQLKNMVGAGLLKRKTPPSYVENSPKAARTKIVKPQLDISVIDIGPPAEWVKINVQKTKDCFEIYALIPGLLREEVHVQSDPAGRLVVSGEPEQTDNLWGVTPFRKVVSLPSRIDPHQISAVVTLHGQLFVRVPFEQSE